MASIPNPEEERDVTADQHLAAHKASFAESMTEIAGLGTETPMDHVNVAGKDMAGVGLTHTGSVSDPTQDVKPPCSEHGQGLDPMSVTNGPQLRGMDSGRSNKRGREEGDDGRDGEISGPSDI